MSDLDERAEQVTLAVARIRDQIADAGGDPAHVQVLAVTKGHDAGAVAAALQAGMVEVGENYAQELLDKVDDPALVGATPSWHFIGRLQSNKVRQLCDHVSCWQSVDRASLVAEIAKRAPGARVLIQVNGSGEDAKGGATPQATPDLVARATDAGLVVAGLMTVGVQGDPVATAAGFGVVRDLADRLGLPERSMGMSGDLVEAVRAGTTMVRIGTAIFGPRPPR